MFLTIVISHRCWFGKNDRKAAAESTANRPTSTGLVVFLCRRDATSHPASIVSSLRQLTA